MQATKIPSVSTEYKQTPCKNRKANTPKNRHSIPLHHFRYKSNLADLTGSPVKDLLHRIIPLLTSFVNKKSKDFRSKAKFCTHKQKSFSS